MKINIFKDGIGKAKEELEKLFNGELTSVSLINIPPIDVENLLEECGAEVQDCPDFNGWQCDYWNCCHFNDKKYDIYGSAWYGTATIMLAEDFTD